MNGKVARFSVLLGLLSLLSWCPVFSQPPPTSTPSRPGDTKDGHTIPVPAGGAFEFASQAAGSTIQMPGGGTVRVNADGSATVTVGARGGFLIAPGGITTRLEPGMQTYLPNGGGSIVAPEAKPVHLPLKTTGTESAGDLPWHLADPTWHLGAATPFESLSVDFQMLDDLPAGVNVFVCPVAGVINDTQFYAGAQNNVADVRDMFGRLSNDVGQGFVFSMWGTTSRDALRAGWGGLHFTGNHEGQHVSARVKAHWGKGSRYTARVVRLDRETIDGIDYVWVGAFIEAHAWRENVFIGATRFPGRELVLNGQLSAFVEVMHWNAKLRPTVPKCRVGFGNIRVNGAPARLQRLEAYYQEGIPQFAKMYRAAEYAAANKLPDGAVPTDEWAVVVDVGDKPLRPQGARETLHSLPPTK